jgi:cytochrome c oxidase subunit 2
VRNGGLIWLTAPALGACSQVQSALSPEGDKAQAVAGLFWLFTAVCAAVWLIVIAIMVVAVLRGRPWEAAPDVEPDRRREHRVGIVVTSGTAITVVILIVLTFASFLTNMGFAGAPDLALTIRISGHQWWWQINYEAHDPSRRFETANELHIPVGQEVRLQFESPDVIHSFWVPNLAGKQDLIPGRLTQLTLMADKPGVYRGQCAEYCGAQHAHMVFYVVVQRPQAFAHWFNAQIGSAHPPQTDEQRRGQMIFMARACATCHTIGGTNAGGIVGPDLTHFGSRMTIAAGTLWNKQPLLEQWIAAPQKIKPYTRMPSADLDRGELHEVAKYLESLK